MSGETARPAPAWFVQLFAHRRWIRRTEPFPHIYARDVFTSGFYERLLAETARVRASTAGDVSLWTLRDGPLAVFTSREWHDLIAGLTELPVSGDITGLLRHHPPGSPAQQPRTGLRRTVFPAHGEPGDALDEADADGRDQHADGTATVGAGRATTRALALLFHLGPDEWRPGDGGETALYPAAGGDPPALVAPLGNSLVLFDCTPYSLYRYLGGNRGARDSVLMWLHRPHDTEGDEHGRR